MKKEVNYIAYYRVSTQRQGLSGLGLEAQQEAVRVYVKDAPILASYTDIESGKSNTRQHLIEAIQHCKNTDATLIIAKLDRLSRNVQFIAALMESRVKFVCCDMPDATPFTIHIFAAVAQWERERISERIKAALQAKRARGESLGKPDNFSPETRLLGSHAMKEKAKINKRNKQAYLVVNMLRKDGHTLVSIMNKLNEMGLQTATGKSFRTEQVRRLIEPEMA